MNTDPTRELYLRIAAFEGTCQAHLLHVESLKREIDTLTLIIYNLLKNQSDGTH